LHAIATSSRSWTSPRSWPLTRRRRVAKTAKRLHWRNLRQPPPVPKLSRRQQFLRLKPAQLLLLSFPLNICYSYRYPFAGELKRRTLFTSLNLSLSHHCAQTRERFLFLAHLLNGIDFARANLKFKRTETPSVALLQPAGLRRHLPILIYFFSSFHNSLGSARFRLNSFRVQSLDCVLEIRQAEG